MGAVSFVHLVCGCLLRMRYAGTRNTVDWWRGFYDSSAVVVGVEEDARGGAGKEKVEDTSGSVPQGVVERFVITAYCPCVKCCGKTDGITASGERAVEGVTIAADTNKYPFGTKILIDGSVYIVQDKGGAIKGNRIDLFFNSHQAALQYGRQIKQVTILKGD